MKNQIEVPQTALGIKYGPEEREVYPEKGDPVEFRVEGTIRRVGAGFCVVDVKFVNGERPGPPPGPDNEDDEGTPYGLGQHPFIPPDAADESALQAMAAAADQGQAYD